MSAIREYEPIRCAKCGAEPPETETIWSFAQLRMVREGGAAVTRFVCHPCIRELETQR